MVLYGIGIDLMFFLKKQQYEGKVEKGSFNIIKVIIYNKQDFVFLEKSL